jgi:PAS domain S-box-containing protein
VGLFGGTTIADDGELNARRLELALRAAEIGIWDWDIPTGEMTYCRRARALYGFTPEQQITIDDVRAATHPEDLPRTSALARRALDPDLRDKPVFEFRLLHPNGDERWALAHGEALFEDIDGKPSPRRYIGTIQDITARKALEKAYSDAQMTQRLAIDAAHMAVWEFDVATEQIRGSAELSRLYGFDPGERPAIDAFRELYLPGELERVRAAAMAALETERHEFEIEFQIRRRDDVERWMLLRARILHSVEDNKPERVIGVLMDIDERKRAEQQRELLMKELNHRVKNSLTVVLAIAGQTFRGGRDLPEALEAFRGRVQALAAANDAILSGQWTSFSLETLIGKILAPFRSGKGETFRLSGPDLAVPPSKTVALALALHELCTNAAKYGSLSVPEGRVLLEWWSDGGQVVLKWREDNGPVAKEGAPGFGTTLMRRMLSAEFDAFELDIRPEGAVCAMRFSL